jgi:hypothetical protein
MLAPKQRFSVVKTFLAFCQEGPIDASQITFVTLQLLYTAFKM